MKNLEDADLRDFLRKNQPIAPLEAPNFEQELFNLLDKESQFKSAKDDRKLILPGAITASLMFILGGAYFLKPAPEIAEQNPEIEEFLVKSWDHTIKGSYINHETTPEGEWLMLTNYQSK
jgi:hypothetical protein